MPWLQLGSLARGKNWVSRHRSLSNLIVVLSLPDLELPKGKARARGSRILEPGDSAESRQRAAPCAHEVQRGSCSEGRAG